MYLARTLEACVQHVAHQFPVLLVNGPRQVGKTTCLQHLAKTNRTYVTLDDPLLAELAKTEPKLFLERFQPPVLIDEIQYAPELLPYIKMHVDQHKQPGQFWLTGSEQFHLMRGVSESLAGRVGLLHLLGLSQWEIRQLPEVGTPFQLNNNSVQIKLAQAKLLSLKKIYETIWRGAFPALWTNTRVDKNLFYSAYISTYLQRDIRHLTQVGDESAFLRFLKVIAARTSQLLNMADIARDTEISPNTAKQWISILQTSGLIYLLEPYHNNLTQRLVKAPKIYFLDTGLCSYLTQWSDANTLEAGAMSGAILETFVMSEIIKSYWHNGLQAPIYYYRDKDKKEIDLLIVQNQTLYPIEIKKTASPTKSAIKHFSVLEKFKKPIGQGAVICLVDTIIPINQHVNALPVMIV